MNPITYVNARRVGVAENTCHLAQALVTSAVTGYVMGHFLKWFTPREGVRMALVKAPFSMLAGRVCPNFLNMELRQMDRPYNEREEPALALAIASFVGFGLLTVMAPLVCRTGKVFRHHIACGFVFPAITYVPIAVLNRLGLPLSWTYQHAVGEAFTRKGQELPKVNARICWQKFYHIPPLPEISPWLGTDMNDVCEGFRRLRADCKGPERICHQLDNARNRKIEAEHHIKAREEFFILMGNVLAKLQALPQEQQADKLYQLSVGFEACPSQWAREATKFYASLVTGEDDIEGRVRVHNQSLKEDIVGQAAELEPILGDSHDLNKIRGAVERDVGLQLGEGKGDGLFHALWGDDWYVGKRWVLSGAALIGLTRAGEFELNADKAGWAYAVRKRYTPEFLVSEHHQYWNGGALKMQEQRMLEIYLLGKLQVKRGMSQEDATAYLNEHFLIDEYAKYARDHGMTREQADAHFEEIGEFPDPYMEFTREAIIFLLQCTGDFEE